MIRIIVQRKERNNKFFKNMLFLKKEFNLSLIDAFLLSYKLNNHFAMIISTAISSKQQCMYNYMDKLHNRLFAHFSTNWRQDIENLGTQIPLDTFDFIKAGDGYRIYLAKKPGYVDTLLNLYEF